MSDTGELQHDANGLRLLSNPEHEHETRRRITADICSLLLLDRLFLCIQLFHNGIHNQATTGGGSDPVLRGHNPAGSLSFQEQNAFSKESK